MGELQLRALGCVVWGLFGAACRRLITGVGSAWGVGVGAFLWVFLGMLLCFAL